MKQQKRVEIPQELVLRAKAGDREAFEALYRRSAAEIFRTVVSMVRDEDTAWDIHQNSYLRAWRSLQQLEKPEAFLPWLRRIAVNETIKELSRKQRLIVGMYYYEGYSIKEIAETLKVTQGTVKNQLHRGRKKVEAQVTRLESEGVSLRGLSPMAFLLSLLDRQELARTLPAKLAPLAEEPVMLTAKAAGSSFFHTALGRLTAGLLITAAAAGGILGWRLLRDRIEAPRGDYRPTETLVITEPVLLSSEPATELPTEADTEVPPAERRMENPFSGPLNSGSESILAAVYNEPFALGVPAPTVVWNTGAADRLTIYPRRDGSTVSARRILYDAEGRASIEETPVYSTRCGLEDCISASLERPAERPCWMLTVQTPDGREADLVLTRNSQYGALCFEYLADGTYAGEDAEMLDLSDFLGDISNRFQGGVGYDTNLRQGEALLCAMLRALEPFGIKGESYAWNAWYADECPVWTEAESRMEGDVCVLEAGVLHEYYMNLLDRENFVEGQGSPELSLAEKIEVQARLFARERLLGYGSAPAPEGETLRVHLHGLLVYNPTLEAIRVSVTVNGQAAGQFALTEGDFFTWIPLDFPELPGSESLRVEARVTEARFGVPEQAILYLWPDLSGNLRGGR